MTESNFTNKCSEILKVDDSLGLVFGFAIVCTEGGEDHYDLQNDHIPEDAMVKAATDFMQKSRATKEMHQGEVDGKVIFAFPMTSDIAKALGMETPRTGLLIGMKPGAEALKKFKDGTYTGFSIGGRYITNEDSA